MADILNALSIDLEDWFHAELVRSRLSEPWPQRRVEWAVAPILELLRRYDVRATFFVVGDVMRHHPQLVRSLYEAGHEIGCHGLSHRPLWSLDPERFCQELAEFDRDAEGVLPLEEIVGFRAPTFSLDERSAWALQILEERGYRYDSSIFPLRTPLYGHQSCPVAPYHPSPQALTSDHPERSGCLEFPMTAYHLGDLAIPISGGVYLRMLPRSLWLYLLSRANAQGRPFVIYVHPWEADTETPRVRKLNPVDRLITYYNLGGTLHKLEALLCNFRLGPLRQVLGLDDARRAVAGVVT